MKSTCGRCRYYVVMLTPNGERTGEGRCHANPPAVSRLSITMEPLYIRSKVAEYDVACRFYECGELG